MALESGADGVHVGAEDQPVDQIRRRVGPGFIIGATAKTPAQAQAAQAAGADYLGVGAVFPSSTKEQAKRITLADLRTICSSVSIPAVAIGGIAQENVEQLRGGGYGGHRRGLRPLRGRGRPVRSPSPESSRLGDHPARWERRAPMKTALSIAGSDSSGGAGIQADLKAMTMNGVYAMSAVTALTAQNTTGVRAILEVTPTFLAQQIDAVFEDIPPDAMKIGMVSSAPLIAVIGARLRAWHAKTWWWTPSWWPPAGPGSWRRPPSPPSKRSFSPWPTCSPPISPRRKFSRA